MHRKSHGIYFTPVQVASFIAGQIATKRRKVRVLDPAAGTGILCCASVEAVMSQLEKPDEIELVAYEIDGELICPLQAVLAYLAVWCGEQFGVILRVSVVHSDFILANAHGLNPIDTVHRSLKVGKFDVVVANPPYFKINKSDPRAVAVREVVHGQPNIYALFMAVSAAMLRLGGSFVFIVPRSFTSGAYFRRFRSVFFSMIRPVCVHVFDSRRNTFRRDGVLQENVVLSGIRQDGWLKQDFEEHVTISSSGGLTDLTSGETRLLPIQTLLDLSSEDKVLRLPLHEADDAAVAIVDSWTTDLRGLGLAVSTGPVVPFRASNLLSTKGKIPHSHTALLWMSHVRPMEVIWPRATQKPEYIEREQANALLRSNKNHVLLRRFTAKEESRRLTAAPWIASHFAIQDVGLENHLNYIHRPGGLLSDDEAWGLAVLLNSRILDTWFRVVNGNTQVNAAELRVMPLPHHEVIVKLGRLARQLEDPRTRADEILVNVLGLPD